MPAPSLAFPAAPAGDSVPIQPSNQPPSLDARIMEQLLNQPELLARFVQVISTSKAKRRATSLQEAEPIRRTSKYSFTPTAVQTAVHEGITAPEHRGKAPSVFVETVVYAAAVRFQPHPGGHHSSVRLSIRDVRPLNPALCTIRRSSTHRVAERRWREHAEFLCWSHRAKAISSSIDR
ncbi:hypothetical protein V7S43_000160 [Phytophthora oleae]|uniref:Uncharacterized protein n=1 Tax=Phytophthora oleae TaxID=2107226 RepID=A0ABD3G855_9STRA